MKKLLGRVILGVAAGVAIYVGFSIWAGARSVGRALADFQWLIVLAALGLASLNYLVRFGRWHYYLKVLGLSVPVGHSLLVFLGGFSLTVTPGNGRRCSMASRHDIGWTGKYGAHSVAIERRPSCSRHQGGVASLPMDRRGNPRRTHRGMGPMKGS